MKILWKIQRCAWVKKVGRCLSWVLLCLCSVVRGETMDGGPKIAVIGAGFSGLTVAYRLQQAGYEVAVYEARSRVGGRVFSPLVKGEIAELGGQNIRDGGEARHLLSLAKELGVECVASFLPLDFKYYHQNKLLSPVRLLKEGEVRKEGLEERIQALSQRVSNMDELLEQLFPHSPELREIYGVMLESYEGGKLAKQSVANWETLYKMLDGELGQGRGWSEYADHLMIKGGNASLAKALAKSLGSGLHLNWALRRVKQTAQGTLQLFFHERGSVEVDVVVLAIPCSVLADVEIDEGVLPLERKEKLEQVPYGSHSKVIIPLDKELSSGQVANEEFVSYFPGNKKQLALYYFGDEGHLKKEAIESALHKSAVVLREGYGMDVSEKVPHWSSGNREEHYEGAVAINWKEDPWSKGSYSYVPAGKEELFEKCIQIAGVEQKALFAPEGQQLFFAGEHTSTLSEEGGTMEAAVQSGEACFLVVDALCGEPSRGQLPSQMDP